MSVLETVLIYVLIPLASYGLIALLTLRSKGGGMSRYRPGADWKYPPVWWSANPAALPSWRSDTSEDEAGSDAAGARRTARGGAHGSW
ncbi:MAG: aa3-type cytochrome oxidase subunit CtaJ [Sciscionella sp.]